MRTVSIEPEDDWYVITDEETGVTTQGRTTLEALLMLADAVAAYGDTDEDLLATAVDVFVRDPETDAFLAELEGEPYVAPDMSEEQVRRQREAALWLTRTYQWTDYADPHRFGLLRSLLFGRAHSLSNEQFAELLDTGAWAVFRAVATDARTVEDITTALDSTENEVSVAVETLERHELVARAADGRLFAVPAVVGIDPYPVDQKHRLDWAKHFDHRLARDLDAEERPTSANEGVVVERQGTGYGWYHDPAEYGTPRPDDVVLSLEDAEGAGSNPCPRCFPTTEFAQQFDVTELPGGITRYERTGGPGDGP